MSVTVTFGNGRSGEPASAGSAWACCQLAGPSATIGRSSAVGVVEPRAPRCSPASRGASLARSGTPLATTCALHGPARRSRAGRRRRAGWRAARRRRVGHLVDAPRVGEMPPGPSRLVATSRRSGSGRGLAAGRRRVGDEVAARRALAGSARRGRSRRWSGRGRPAPGSTRCRARRASAIGHEHVRRGRRRLVVEALHRREPAVRPVREQHQRERRPVVVDAWPALEEGAARVREPADRVDEALVLGVVLLQPGPLAGEVLVAALVPLDPVGQEVLATRRC